MEGEGEVGSLEQEVQTDVYLRMDFVEIKSVDKNNPHISTHQYPESKFRI